MKAFAWHMGTPTVSACDTTLMGIPTKLYARTVALGLRIQAKTAQQITKMYALLRYITCTQNRYLQR